MIDLSIFSTWLAITTRNDRFMILSQNGNGLPLSLSLSFSRYIESRTPSSSSILLPPCTARHYSSLSKWATAQFAELSQLHDANCPRNRLRGLRSKGTLLSEFSHRIRATIRLWRTVVPIARRIEKTGEKKCMLNCNHCNCVIVGLIIKQISKLYSYR